MTTTFTVETTAQWRRVPAVEEYGFSVYEIEMGAFTGEYEKYPDYVRWEIRFRGQRLDSAYVDNEELARTAVENYIRHLVTGADLDV